MMTFKHPYSQMTFICAGFVALGDMAMALAKAHSAKGMEGCLAAVAAQIREAIAPPAKGRSRTHSPEALNVRTWFWPQARAEASCRTRRKPATGSTSAVRV